MANDLILDQAGGRTPHMRGKPGRIAAVQVDESVGRSTTSLLQASSVEPRA